MLLDHFHPPLSELGWKGFHHQWAAVLAADLNARLPVGWRAQADVDFGIEVDVGVVESDDAPSKPDSLKEPSDWMPPSAVLSMPGPFDAVEVKIINRSYSPSVVGAIELVSPANKDRPDHRRAFVSKCHAILHEGAGLIVMDIVTERRKNLHYELLDRLGRPQDGAGPRLYTVAYGVFRSDKPDHHRVHIWEEPLELGRPLPIMPLCLRVGPTLPVDFESTYQLACQQLRISVPQAIQSA
ncbi:MAG: DUF4058 family protein [Planctomycetaceae bacterium]|nr:DUF4058 family protein [Planctomycetaceae bacterium]